MPQMKALDIHRLIPFHPEWNYQPSARLTQICQSQRLMWRDVLRC